MKKRDIFWNSKSRGNDFVKKEELVKGKQLYTTGESWIVTEVLNDGEFMAIEKEKFDRLNALTNKDFGNRNNAFVKRQKELQIYCLSCLSEIFKI